MAPREVLRETQKQEEVGPEWGFRLAKVEVPTATETREGSGAGTRARPSVTGRRELNEHKIVRSTSSEFLFKPIFFPNNFTFEMFFFFSGVFLCTWQPMIWITFFKKVLLQSSELCVSGFFCHRHCVER